MRTPDSGLWGRLANVGLVREKPSKQKASRPPPPLTHLAALSPLDMTAQSREQSSRIKGHRRAAGRADTTGNTGACGRSAERQQQQPRGGRIAVSGDERQGQCGSQQADRGEEAAKICDTSPQVNTAVSPPYHPKDIMVEVFIFHQWWLLLIPLAFFLLLLAPFFLYPISDYVQLKD